MERRFFFCFLKTYEILMRLIHTFMKVNFIEYQEESLKQNKNKILKRNCLLTNIQNRDHITESLERLILNKERGEKGLGMGGT